MHLKVNTKEKNNDTEYLAIGQIWMQVTTIRKGKNVSYY